VDAKPSDDAAHAETKPERELKAGGMDLAPSALFETTPEIKSTAAVAGKELPPRQAEIFEIMKEKYQNGRLPSAAKRNKEIQDAAVAKGFRKPSDRHIRTVVAIFKLSK
jgi:hypothetical protein